LLSVQPALKYLVSFDIPAHSTKFSRNAISKSFLTIPPSLQLYLQDKEITYKVAKLVSFKPKEPRSLTVFHIRITKQKIKKSSIGRIGQHQVIELNGQTQLNKQEGQARKKAKQQRIAHKVEPKECV